MTPPPTYTNAQFLQAGYPLRQSTVSVKALNSVPRNSAEIPSGCYRWAVAERSEANTQ